MILSADMASDLDWSQEIAQLKSSQGPVLIEFSFGWDKAPFLINDPAAFQSFTLALDQFSKDVWPLIQDRCKGAVLFRGSLKILSNIVVADGDLTPVEAATVFGNYLHRLASFLPEEATPYCLFEDHAGYTAGEAAQLLSEERFLHLQLSLEPAESPMGVLLPTDELCYPDVIKNLNDLLQEMPDLRVIPERRLNELWSGLDELIVFEEVLTAYGKRQLLGFEAAGGKIRSRGIRTPDPLLPKQMR